MISINGEKAESDSSITENYFLKLLNLIAIGIELISLGYVILDPNLYDFISYSFIY